MVLCLRFSTLPRISFTSSLLSILGRVRLLFGRWISYTVRSLPNTCSKYALMAFISVFWALSEMPYFVIWWYTKASISSFVISRISLLSKKDKNWLKADVYNLLGCFSLGKPDKLGRSSKCTCSESATLQPNLLDLTFLGGEVFLALSITCQEPDLFPSVIQINLPSFIHFPLCVFSFHSPPPTAYYSAAAFWSP